jgi:hypothetical protein
MDKYDRGRTRAAEIGTLVGMAAIAIVTLLLPESLRWWVISAFFVFVLCAVAIGSVVGSIRKARNRSSPSDPTEKSS